MAADVVNVLMDEYADYSIEQKRISSDQILSFIDTSLHDYGLKLDSVQKKLLDYEQANNLIDAEVQSSNYFGNITETDKALNEQTVRSNVADIIDGYLADKRNEFTRVIVPSSLGLDDITLNNLVEGYNKAQFERQQLLDSDVPADNPSVQTLTRPISKQCASVFAKTFAILKTRST